MSFFFLNIMAIQQKYSATSNASGFSHLLNYKTGGYFALYKIQHSDKQTQA